VALEPTSILHGLLAPAEIRRRFVEAGISSLDPETSRLEHDGDAGLRGFLATLLGLAGARRREVMAEARRASDRWLRRLLDLYPEDPAALAPLFLHRVELEPGQALFQAPGVLHCYLEGSGVEVMASSDNVVRAGLTTKPIDVDEVLAVASTTPAEPATIEALTVSPGIARYRTEAEEFELWRMEATPAAASSLDEPGALVLGVCTRGGGRLVSPSRGESLELRSGGAFAVRPGAGALRLDGDLCVYAATTP
jgi:mannose-6-phosphate isomerase